MYAVIVYVYMSMFVCVYVYVRCSCIYGACKIILARVRSRVFVMRYTVANALKYRIDIDFRFPFFYYFFHVAVS